MIEARNCIVSLIFVNNVRVSIGSSGQTKCNDSFLQAFAKAQKTKAYFKRYQVKFKRRRGIFHFFLFILMNHI